MIALTSNMEIGDYTFNFCNEVEIISSWENLTDTATIRVPRKLRIKKNGLFSDNITSGESALWRRGDPVKIYAGYDGENDLRFEGVITKISPKLPLEFSCEDKMFILKQTQIKNFKRSSVTIKELLDAIIPDGMTHQEEDIQLGKFSIENATVAEVLDYLKRKFGISSYFQDGSLYVGLAYKSSSIDSIATEDLVQFEFQKNIIDDNSLDYVRDDDVSLNVTAVNIHSNNTRKEIQVGDTLGEKRTIYFYNINDSDLTKLATEALEKLKYEGFRGSFTTFLQPHVKHGQAIKLIDPMIPDRNGVYLVRKVTTSFGVSGGRQQITLDRKIA